MHLANAKTNICQPQHGVDKLFLEVAFDPSQGVILLSEALLSEVKSRILAYLNLSLGMRVEFCGTIRPTIFNYFPVRFRRRKWQLLGSITV